MATVRPCNNLESFFAAENVRFSGAVSFPPCDVRTVETALRHASSSNDQNAAIGLWICLENGARLSVRDILNFPKPSTRVVPETDIKSLLHALEEDLSENYETAWSIQLLKTVQDDNKCIGVIINANHAVCDGRYMKHLITSLVQNLSMPIDTSATIPVPPRIGSDIGQVLPLPSRPDGAVLPLFPRCRDVKHIKPTDLAPQSSPASQHSAGCIHRIIPSHLMTKARSRCKNIPRNGKRPATVTGLLLAAWSIALAKTYHSRADTARHNECGISISTLVDMTPFLPSGAACTQAISTITIGSVHQRNDWMHIDGQQTRILQLATQLTDQLLTRIENGEAHAQALAMANGTPSVAGDGTIELSNIGVFDVPHDCAVVLGQRFDKFRGVSVTTHSEHGTGIFRIAASWAAALDSRVMSQVVDTVLQVLSEIGK